VPPPPIRRLRDLTRYRRDLVEARTAEKQRAEKLLQDPRSRRPWWRPTFSPVSGRQKMGALVAGERDPKVSAQMARTSLRRKIGRLEEAFTGYFTDHHAFLLSTMARMDAITADIARVHDKIEELITPFRPRGGTTR
jgi:transposase